MRRRLAFLLVLVLLATTLAGCATNETAAEPASIVDAKIDENGNLILFMSSGTTINAGYVRGMQGEDGVDGIDGVNGDSIASAYVDEYGDLQLQLSDNRVVNAGHVQGADGRNGRDGADGQDGRDGKDGEDGEDGRDGVDGKDGQDGKDGLNGQDGKDGEDGEDGKDGITPTIGENGNWWIGDTDTGVQAGAGEEFIFNDRGNGTTLLAYVGHDPDVVIPEKTRFIGEGAFQNNKSLTTVKIPNNVDSIGYNAFSGCISLESVDFPDNLWYIEENAFSGCVSLVSVNFPENLDGIGKSAFKGCTSLSEIDLTSKSDGFSIGESAFEGCFNLRKITFPTGLRFVRNRAFYNTRLEVVTIPQKVSYIGEEAFAQNRYLQSLTFSHTDKSAVQLQIGDRAFYDCGNFYYDDGSGTNSGFTSVSLPKCLYSLGNEVFAQCSRLQSVSMPLIRNWGTGTFQNCYKLENFTFSSENLSGSGDFTIPAYTFSNCSALQSFDVPDRVKRIEEYAFYACTSLSMPDFSNVENIDACAFYACVGLTGELRLSTHIADKAFMACENIESLTLTVKNAEKGGVSVGDFAFTGCENLKEARLFVNEEEGGEGTTDNAYSLYGQNIFVKCPELERIVLGSALNPNWVEQGGFCPTYDGQDVTKQTFIIYSSQYPSSNSFLDSDYNLDDIGAIYVQPELVDDYRNQWYTYRDKIYPIESFGISVGAIQEDGSVKELKSVSNTQEIYVEYDYESFPPNLLSKFKEDGRFAMIRVSGFSGYSAVSSIRINGQELRIEEELCNFADTVNASKETIVSGGYLCFHEEMTRRGFRKAYDITIEGTRNGQSVTETSHIVAEFRPIGYVENPVASIAAVKSLSDKIQAEWDAEQNQLTLSYRSTDIEEITNLSSALEFTFHDKNGKPFEEVAIIYAGYTDFFVPTNEEGQIIEDGAKLTEESTVLMKIPNFPEWENAVFGGESYDLVIRTSNEEYEPLDFTVYYVMLDGEPNYIRFENQWDPTGRYQDTIFGIGTQKPLRVVNDAGMDITDQCEFFYYDRDAQEITDGANSCISLNGSTVTALKEGEAYILAKYKYNGVSEFTTSCSIEVLPYYDMRIQNVESLSEALTVEFDEQNRTYVLHYTADVVESTKTPCVKITFTDAEGNPFPDGATIDVPKDAFSDELSTDLQLLDGNEEAKGCIELQDSSAFFQLKCISNIEEDTVGIGFCVDLSIDVNETTYRNPHNWFFVRIAKKEEASPSNVNDATPTASEAIQVTPPPIEDLDS